VNFGYVFGLSRDCVLSHNLKFGYLAKYLIAKSSRSKINFVIFDDIIVGNIWDAQKVDANVSQIK